LWGDARTLALDCAISKKKSFSAELPIRGARSAVGARSSTVMKSGSRQRVRRADHRAYRIAHDRNTSASRLATQIERRALAVDVIRNRAKTNWFFALLGCAAIDDKRPRSSE
jgi:hypothetical protein